MRDYDEDSCRWSVPAGGRDIDIRKPLLIAKMADMQKSLDRLNHKIEHDEQGEMTKEQLLKRNRP